jgi:hypothetical protein
MTILPGRKEQQAIGLKSNQAAKALAITQALAQCHACHTTLTSAQASLDQILALAPT